MKKLFLVAVLATIAPSIYAQSPNWADDVANILYGKCTNCHHPGGIAPFSLITYNDAANVAPNIQNAVTMRRMPPWPPDTAYTRFAHERVLTQQEITTIDNWVTAGFPSGNISNAPPAPTYTAGPVISNPDLAAQMQTYTVNTATDLYRCFVVPSGIMQDEYITKVEVVPGNRPIVHHVLVYQDVQSTCVTLDNNDPGPGYTSFGGVGSNTATLIAGWVPGQGVYELPPNMGIKLEANSYIIMQIHYPSGTFNQTDSTQVRFTFSSGVVRNVTLVPAINHATSLTNGPLLIPANTARTFNAQVAISSPVTLISVAPHMHLIGKSIWSWAVDPSGDTIPLISIPDWNFHWQGFYTYRQPVVIPGNSMVYASAYYDNTANNPNNPNNPPQLVTAGEATDDEMMVIYYAYLPYQPGDENIIIDSIVLNSIQQNAYQNIIRTPQLYDPYPVPTSGNTPVAVGYFIPEVSSVVLQLFDQNGRLVREWNRGSQSAGLYRMDVAIADLPAGTYTISLNTGNARKSKQIIVH